MKNTLQKFCKGGGDRPESYIKIEEIPTVVYQHMVTVTMCNRYTEEIQSLLTYIWLHKREVDACTMTWPLRGPDENLGNTRLAGRINQIPTVSSVYLQYCIFMVTPKGTPRSGPELDDLKKKYRF